MIIETRNLTKEYNGIKALKDVSFSVKEGEIFGFLGPNGAGKTTTIKILTTLLMPTSGEVYVNGYNVVEEATKVRESIGLVPQENVLENDLTARENLIFHGMLYNIKGRKLEDRVEKALKFADLESRADEKVRNFSGGTKRRLETVKAFLHSPKIIFLDEPSLGLDPQSRRLFWDYIEKINKEEKITIFLTTHYMDEADYLCDRVCIIDVGKILDLDTPKKLKEKFGEGEVVEITVPKARKFAEILKEKCECNIIKVDEERLKISSKHKERALTEIFKNADELGVSILDISVREPTLEDVFIHYTGKGIREGKGDFTKAVLRRFKG